MFKRLFYAALALLAAIVLSASAATGTPSSSATPTLFSVHGAPQVLAGGAQKLYPVTIDENQAFSAIFKGGMWLPNPAGGREYARYARHLIHDNGDWTFIGKVPTAHGDQSVVITFGKDAVFGMIPQMNGYPLRVVTRHGQTLLMQTSGDMLGRSPTALALRATQDFKIPPRRARSAAAASAISATTQSSAQQQTTAAPTVDVMVAYTAGFVSEYGTVSAALTRINNLVDVTNQAYVDSHVNEQIRLVHTVQVGYPDNNSNSTALDDITGSDGTNPVPIPSSLQAIAGLRTQYGADLVSLVRSFDNATDGGCGLGWLIGGGLQAIVPSQDYVFGYSVVSDGSDAGYYCLDSTFAHELGHNMGSAHDRAHADKDKNGNPTPGAYSYSFGFDSASSSGFSTIMAYGGASQTPLDLFSNPNISICQGQPCGVADNSSSSADNVHSLNNTASLIAQFEATKVVSTSIVHNDVNGDGKSDLFWYNQSNLMTYWLMNGPDRLSYQVFTVPSGYQPIGSGDFDGNGHADILWKTSSGDLEMWLDDGQAFTPRYVRSYPNGWVLAGVGDENGDGNADLFWYNPTTGQVTCWLMNGATLLHYLSFSTSPGLQPLAIGDFDGNGSADILWKTSSGAIYMWLFNGTSFNYYNIGAYPSGWVLAGVGDEDGDGKTDLFWYNPTTGRITYWLMNGQTTRLFRAFLTSPGLKSLGTGDYDADGHSDLLWMTSSGAMYMWLFDGTSYKYYGIGAYPAGWIPIP